MESDDDLIEEIATAPAFRRKWKKTSKHRPTKYLPDEMEYHAMLVCTTAAGDVAVGAEWYETKPLSDVYRWLAVRLAQIEE